jgi:hypothetical protein
MAMVSTVNRVLGNSERKFNQIFLCGDSILADFLLFSASLSHSLAEKERLELDGAQSSQSESLPIFLQKSHKIP